MPHLFYELIISILFIKKIYKISGFSKSNNKPDFGWLYYNCSWLGLFV